MNTHIQINLSEQTLQLLQADLVTQRYLVSTATNGAGERMGSECTPTGKHIIGEKIGADCAANTVFVGRRATGESYSAALRQQYPERDWILTRILWLAGCEPGKNKGDQVDSHDRYIYIHGSPDDVAMGRPGSKGCVRMSNQDIIELFELVDVGMPVELV